MRSSRATFSIVGQAHSSPIVQGATDWNAATRWCIRSESIRPSLTPISSTAIDSMRAVKFDSRFGSFGSSRKKSFGRLRWISTTSASMVGKLSSSQSVAGSTGTSRWTSSASSR